MAEASNARRRTALGAATVISSGIITVMLLFVSRSTAYTPSDLRTLELGLPLAWVIQDQSYFDPSSFPYQASFVSPWEHPMTVNLPLMLVNLLIVAGLLWLLVLGWVRFSGRRRVARQNARIALASRA